MNERHFRLQKPRIIFARLDVLRYHSSTHFREGCRVLFGLQSRRLLSRSTPPLGCSVCRGSRVWKPVSCVGVFLSPVDARAHRVLGSPPREARGEGELARVGKTFFCRGGVAQCWILVDCFASKCVIFRD